MKLVEDFIVPWVKAAEPYSDKHMDIAWENPAIIRMMSNENLIAPSQKVIDAIIETARLGNLYPGSGPMLREKLGAGCWFERRARGAWKWFDRRYQFRGAYLCRSRGRSHYPNSHLPHV